MADTRYHEAPVDLMSEDFEEPRRCEECDTCVSHVRVKHCHLCNKCVMQFDHHCRYLNSCIAGRTYKAWVLFIIGLLLLMVTCGFAAVHALVRQTSSLQLTFGSEMRIGTDVTFLIMALTSIMLAMFLFCLLAQHAYLASRGITTLEYVKSQPEGFPALPPKGWRSSTRESECYNCQGYLELTECEDKDDVWFCTVCQVDLAKAQVPFLACGTCECVSICIACRRAAERPDKHVITSRISTLRREAPFAERPQGNGYRAPSEVGSGMSSKRDQCRHLRNQCSSELRELQMWQTPRGRRSSFSHIIASVEGSTGDAEQTPCWRCCGDTEEESASDSMSSEENPE